MAKWIANKLLSPRSEVVEHLRISLAIRSQTLQQCDTLHTHGNLIFEKLMVVVKNGFRTGLKCKVFRKAQ
jgi:hypothetical protein